VTTRSQPIGVGDVLAYLVEALERPGTAGRVPELGGADVLSYRDMLLGYARLRGLRRRLVVVPVLTPRLSSSWVTLVTPVPASIARPLIEGLRSETVVRDPAALEMFDVAPMGYERAVRRALDRMSAGEVESVWSGAAASLPARRPAAERPAGEEGTVVDRHSAEVHAPAERVFAVIASLGGERGWLYANSAWRARGLLDRLAGGTGMRRGRRDPRHLRVGDALDFWRVEAVEPGRRILLRAEMKIPGHAWLEMTVGPSRGGSRLDLTALFEPTGLGGRAYWYGLLPVHRLIFAGLLGGVAAAASQG
jgi:hypothetical protein